MNRNIFKELLKQNKDKKTAYATKVIPNNSEDKDIAKQYEKILNHLMKKPEFQEGLEEEARIIFGLRPPKDSE